MVCMNSFLIFIILYVDCLVKVSSQPIGFSKNIVGLEKDMICSLSVYADVSTDTVEIAWLNEDDIITDDSRVTINMASDYYNGSTLVTVIHFDPLAEDDERKYFCYAISNGSLTYESINLNNLIGT